MTNLHWALLAIAGVLLLALWIYGKWQERRAIARLDAAMRDGVGDPLAAVPAGAAVSARPLARRIEPRLDVPLGSPAMQAAGELPGPGTTPAVGQAGAESSPEVEAAERADVPAYALPDGWAEDPLLDFVVELRCAHAVDGVAALEARGQLERLQLPLPTHLAVWDARTQQWTAPDRFGFYSELLVAVQLAHRHGALVEIDAARFVAAAQQIALALDADFDVPDVPRLVAQAAELDRLCARFDVQITLTLEAAEAPWTADVVQPATAAVGFAPAGSGRWELRDSGGALQLVLAAPQMPASRLAVTVDVPLARPDASPLIAQFDAAEQLATRLSARVVDDNGRPVQREAHLAFAGQLAGLHEQMQAAGITAGSERARRLYAS
jgi:HAMP domain-containing protein